MLTQLSIGSAIILATMGVMVGFVYAAIRYFRKLDERLGDRKIGAAQLLTVLSGGVLLVLAANTVCVWIWALSFRLLNVFSTLEEAVYFSLVSFTTVGYGDVVVGVEWRILSGFVAVNGLLAFGLFTAFLIEMIRGISKRIVN